MSLFPLEMMKEEHWYAVGLVDSSHRKVFTYLPTGEAVWDGEDLGTVYPWTLPYLPWIISMLAVSHWAEKNVSRHSIPSLLPVLTTQRNATQHKSDIPPSVDFLCNLPSPSCHYHAVHASNLAPTHSLSDFVISEDGTVPQQAPSHIYPAQRLLRQAIRPTGLHAGKSGTDPRLPVHPTYHQYPGAPGLNLEAVSTSHESPKSKSQEMEPRLSYGYHPRGSLAPASHCQQIVTTQLENVVGRVYLPPGFIRPTRPIHYGIHPPLGNRSLHIRTPIHCNNGLNPLPHQHASASFRKSESWHLTGLQGPPNDRSFAPVPVFVPSSPSQLRCPREFGGLTQLAQRRVLLNWRGVRGNSIPVRKTACFTPIHANNAKALFRGPAR
ncbi:uncharacterized protein BDZ83DRAFT_646449 [Colletotrichum acutatum]|uniref:Uncharacterized protein n=1 Tax=Glomerella acutata TaxID=27357 RepID=A0AAD9D230_GLOAC|nr:uncharacterized protein BDZ83DRAFT_646449 [Colletotrichum acutatum]KAK1731017.1 hypothetical protein BDZ83DRAFT_646449 [Colletotrichum acutatum]